jgi:hypothetical protein
VFRWREAVKANAGRTARVKSNAGRTARDLFEQVFVCQAMILRPLAT